MWILSWMGGLIFRFGEDAPAAEIGTSWWVFE